MTNIIHLERPIMGLARGDLFGARFVQDHQNVLFCEVRKASDNRITAYVINGNWDIPFYRTTGLSIPSEDGGVNLNGVVYEIFYTGDDIPKVPDGCCWDYNYAIQYMIEHADDPVILPADSHEGPETYFVEAEIPF